MSDTLQTIRWQSRVLADRYFECVLGDLLGTLMIVGQAPAIGFVITLAWGDAPRTETLFFMIALTGVWCGCINACREIVKERPIFIRERMMGVRPFAYVLSKLRVLAYLAAAQTIALILVLNQNLDLGASVWLLGIGVFLATVAGASLGLIVSAFSSTQNRAVALVPLVLIPQILFSHLILPRKYRTWAALWAERLTLLRWAHEPLWALHEGQGAWIVTKGWLLLAIFTATLIIVTSLVLAGAKPE